MNALGWYSNERGCSASTAGELKLLAETRSPESAETNRRVRYRIQLDPLEPGDMADFEPVLSRNWNVPDSNTLRVYESRGGYQAARKALTGMDPDQVVSIVKNSELRGRGGAGFPCGLKWSFLPKDRKETFMCVNTRMLDPTMPLVDFNTWGEPQAALTGQDDRSTLDDYIDEASEESFPASDPPAWTPLKIGPPR